MATTSAARGSNSAYQRIDVHALSGAVGAEILGVDLNRLDDATFEEIQRAFLEHLVIFFREQSITPEVHKAFARRFGELRVSDQYVPLAGHPEILEIVKEPDGTSIVGNLWHCDESFKERPALGSVLYMIECPEVGGDTMFANQYLAYEMLSAGMQKMLTGLRAVYSDGSLGERNYGRSLKLLPGAASRPGSSAVHPVVRTHPQTGRKALFVHRPYTVCFEDMTPHESEPLLTQLFAHASRPEFTCRFRWQPGSIAFWDNRCVQHYALNDYSGVRRYAHRVTIVGDVPR
jgi:taurine dioxygenase